METETVVYHRAEKKIISIDLLSLTPAKYQKILAKYPDIEDKWSFPRSEYGCYPLEEAVWGEKINLLDLARIAKRWKKEGDIFLAWVAVLIDNIDNPEGVKKILNNPTPKSKVLQWRGRED
jgi:hypothetical protein